MKALIALLIVCTVLENVFAARSICLKISSKRSATVKYDCNGMKTLSLLEKIRRNTTHLMITDSTIPNIPGHGFARFGATLVSLNMHQCGIRTIDPDAFMELAKLEELILWGNKLEQVPGNWFAYAQNIRTLDLSFNLIDGLDSSVFFMLPRLRNFYFDYNRLRYIDYNLFGNLVELQEVKFGKNPLTWPYRARLTWQLETQHVKFTEEWESWAWMSTAIKECTESGQGTMPEVTVLDCVSGKLLDFVYEVSTDKVDPRNANSCQNANLLLLCVRSKNSTTGWENESVRKILEDYAKVLPQMTRSLVPFSSVVYQ